MKWFAVIFLPLFLQMQKFKRPHYLSGTNIPHLGKFGKSSTPNRLFREYVSSQEGKLGRIGLLTPIGPGLDYSTILKFECIFGNDTDVPVDHDGFFMGVP